MNKEITRVHRRTMELLMNYEWPGNVRELENVIERAFILCREKVIEIPHLPEELTARGAPSPASSGIQSAHDLLDARCLQLALERNDFNRSAAARELGIHKSTFFRKIRKLGITLPAANGRSHRHK
jgi:DNA-binding NtrC family response regulator